MKQVFANLERCANGFVKSHGIAADVVLIKEQTGKHTLSISLRLRERPGFSMATHKRIAADVQEHLDGFLVRNHPAEVQLIRGEVATPYIGSQKVSVIFREK